MVLLSTRVRISSRCITLFLLSFLVLTGSFQRSSFAAQKCEEWVGRVVSVQGRVQALKAEQSKWVEVELDDTYCAGDTLQVLEQSRAAVVLRNDVVLRLDQNTTLTFIGPDPDEGFLLRLLSGAVHLFSRTPKPVKVLTPYVNAAVGGTEFTIRVDGDRATVSVFEGTVSAVNDMGSVSVGKGQTVMAQAGEAPAPVILVRPRDAVQWALYYPPILDYRPSDFDGVPEDGWQPRVRKSLELYWENDLQGAFASLDGVPKDVGDPRFFAYRAALLLTVGRVEEARADIDQALSIDPQNSHAFALQSIIAVTQNDKETALMLAKKAVELGPASSAAHVALSYAQQANFDLKGALDSLKEAVGLAPENALAWARLAEIELSLGYLDRALEAARRAVELRPNLARTRTVLGFAFLTQIKTEQAEKAFRKAIALDQADPLPRLGLGLALIRDGKLKEGRIEIEIAVCLDPGNSIIRSYMGKAYFEEKRDKRAQDQYSMAKELDPRDPTPWFYDAILKQTVNRPVEALEDLQKSIELNDNRAVYRSRLQLDQDLAARSASLGRIYDDLGFQQLGMLEGWKSLSVDPGNYSAHRFLADSYASQPRHEIARVSEVLQSQLLQPININPIQPQMAQSKLFIFEGAGPSSTTFNEFNPLFNRNRFTLQASGVVGGKGTLGDEVVQSGLWGKFSYSLGQFHYATDGFRQNNGLEENIYNAFAQFSLSEKTSILGEFRDTDLERGDLLLRFDPDLFFKSSMQEDLVRSERISLRHSFSPRSEMLATFAHFRAKYLTDVGSEDFPIFLPIRGLNDRLEDEGYMMEAQQHFRWERFSVVGGISHFRGDENEARQIRTIFPSDPPADVSDTDQRHTDVYAYSLIRFPEDFIWTLGASAEFFDDGIVEREQVNPKLGVTWSPFGGTTLRAALFKALKRNLVTDQTLEPTHVAGFNQFFDDPNGTKSTRYGVGVDQKILSSLYGGVEFSGRELEVPFENLAEEGRIDEADWKEKLLRVYLYWAPHPYWALALDYQFEHFDRVEDLRGTEDFVELETHRVPLGVSFFHPSGIIAKLKATVVHQEGKFGDTVETGSDQFWVLDAGIAYRLPKRWGIVSLEGKNLLDNRFRFQDTDPANPSIFPERIILFKITLAY